MLSVAIRYDVQFHVPATFRSFSDEDVLLNYVAQPVEVFGNKIFEVRYRSKST